MAAFALEWAMRHAALRQLPLTVTPGWAGMMVVPSDEQYLIKARDAAQDAVAKAGAEAGHQAANPRPG